MLFQRLITPVLLVGLLAGCAPPPKIPQAQGPQFPSDGGRPVLPAKPESPGPYKTIEIRGVEHRQSRGAVGQPGGTFYNGELGDGPKTFNPWASYDSTSSSLGGMLTSGLVETDAYTGEVVPALAKSWSVAPDRCTYTVTLRKGLTWSDGQPLTSRDVVFTWNEIIKAGLGNPSTRDALLIDGRFPEVTALDPLSIRFKTAKPFAPFLRQLGNNIAPAHVFEPIIKKGGDAAFSAAWGVQDAIKHPEKFVSSGMWLLERYESSQRVVFKRNPRFYMVDKAGKPLPYLDRYVVSFVKDLNNAQLQFEQGKVDTYGVAGQFVARTRRLKQPDFNLYSLGPASSTSFFLFNLTQRRDKDTGKPLVNPVASRWFNDRNFRQAVDFALDRNDMVQNILKGVGTPLFTAESLSSIFVNQSLVGGHPQDLAKAKALLEKSGFTWDAQGKLHDREGHPVSFTLFTNTGNDQREATGVSIKQDLAKLGMTVHFKPMDFNVLVGKMNTGDWEAMIMGLTGSNLEPHDGANVWKSNGALHLFNQRDVKALAGKTPPDRLPWEAEIDDLFERGAQTFPLAERQAIYNRFQEIVYQELPFIYLYSPVSIVAVKQRIQNFAPTPLGAFHNLEEIWIKPEDR